MLSDPVFVYSFEEGEHVYFVFRETASEMATEVGRHGLNRYLVILNLNHDLNLHLKIGPGIHLLF